MNNIALLGGSFNPIGLHHIHLGQIIYDKLGICTWYMPCYNHRFQKTLESPGHRWNMIMMASEKHEWMLPCDWEIAHSSNGSMFDTMTHLSKANPHTTFHIVIGMDNANVINKWDHGESLAKKHPFIVFTRPSVDPTADWFTCPPHRILQSESSDQSSEIRRAIQNGDYEFVKQRLHPRVWEYIQTGRLYGYK